MQSINDESITWAKHHRGHHIAQNIFAYAVQHGMLGDWEDPRFLFARSSLTFHFET